MNDEQLLLWWIGSVATHIVLCEDVARAILSTGDPQDGAQTYVGRLVDAVNASEAHGWLTRFSDREPPLLLTPRTVPDHPVRAITIGVARTPAGEAYIRSSERPRFRVM